MWRCCRSSMAIRSRQMARYPAAAISIRTVNAQANLLSAEAEPEKCLPENDYEHEFHQNHIEVNCMQRAVLTAGSTLVALYDPRRHDMVACMGETTAQESLRHILKVMKRTEEGRRVLEEKPRINTRTVDLEKLRQLPPNTFGYTYVKFLDDNKVTPDSREAVHFIEEPELAYVMTRYRECHDLIHAILNMPTNMLGEVVVKWVEALNIGLPMCYGGAVFGALRLKNKQRLLYTSKYLPWAIKNGRNAKPLMSVYWEEHWTDDVNELRKKLNITLDV